MVCVCLPLSSFDQPRNRLPLCVQELLGHLPYGKVPDLVELTYAAYDVIKKTTRDTAAAAVNPQTCEYVIIAGVQIHGPDGKNFFWPGEITKFADGKETDLVRFLRTGTAKSA